MADPKRVAIGCVAVGVRAYEVGLRRLVLAYAYSLSHQPVPHPRTSQARILDRFS
jgi:hypothetical protein